MELCADAPIATIEFDRLSLDSACLCFVDRTVVITASQQNVANSFDLLGFDSLGNGSLSDLVLNFEDRICPEEHDHDRFQNAYDASLSQVRFWWVESVGSRSVSKYPLGDAPTKLGTYDELESADADGITEENDSLVDEVASVGHMEPVSTDSGSSLSASPVMAVGSNEFPTSPLEDNTPVESRVNGHTEATTLLDSWKHKCANSCPSEMVHWPNDLMRLSGKLLRLHIEGLTFNIMQQSDQLVELLAARDELVMLREASDDFIVLLDLLHQRRALASRAALVQTAKSRIRLKGFIRSRLPWFAQNSSVTHTSGAPSCHDSCGSFSILFGRKIVSCSNAGLSASVTEKVSAAYMQSLNLQSKRRRPAYRPIIPKAFDAKPIDRNTLAVHVLSCDTNRTTVGSFGSSLLPNDQAQERLAVLRKLSSNLTWPNNQPRSSQSLILQLPFERDSTYCVTLSRLRVINQILYAALLENPATEQLVSAYCRSVEKRNDIGAWIDQSHDDGSISSIVATRQTSK